MPSGSKEVGRYVLPIMPSIEGIGPEIDRKLGKAFDGVAKQASQALAGGVQDGVKAAESAVKKSADKIAALKDKEADAAGRLRVAEERLNEVREKGGSAAARAEEARERALRQHAAALRNVENETKSLESAQRRLESAQRDVAQGPSNAGAWLDGIRGKAESALSGLDSLGTDGGAGMGAGFLDGFGGAIASLGTKAGPIGIALAGAATLGLGLGKELVDQVEAGMQSLATEDLFAAKLGVDDATMDRIAKQAGEAFANGWGESVPDNLKAGEVAFKARLLDPRATDDEIQHTIEQIQTLSTVMDADIQEVARGAGKLLTTHVAKTADEAFDLLTVGAQKGLDLTGDLIDTMEEYATKFRDVGLSGKESLGLINQLLEGGARNTDVAADALKEFSIRVVDNSKTTRDAFSTLGLNADDMAAKFAAGGQQAHDAFDVVLDKLRDVHDPLVQESTGVQLFGTKWEDVGDAVKRVDLTTAAAELGQVEGASKNAAGKVSEHASQWDLLGRNMSTTFANFQKGFAESGLGRFLGSTLPGKLNELFSPPGPPVLPPVPVGETIGSSGLIGPPTGPIPNGVQGPGIPANDAGIPRVPDQGSLPPFLIPVAPPYIDPRITAPVPRALGGIDGIGTEAHIGAPVYPNGLVRYREPSTGGEAYIPLNASQRSIDIWQETGRQLGVWAFAQGGMLGDAGGLLPFTQQLRALTFQTWPMISDILGYRSPDGYNEHSSGRALDVMIPNWQSPPGIALGNQIAQWALSIPGVDRVMWQSSIIRPGGQVEPVPDRGSPTANHMDHVHVFTDDVGAGQVPTPSMAAFHTSLGSTPGFGGVGFSGTPGVNPETGESGYFVPDTKAVKSAQDKVADADARVALAEQRQRELEADAKESQKMSAQDEVDRTRREAADARAELTEAQRGKFTTGPKTAKGEADDGAGDLSPLGGIFGSFLKETLGVDGSLFPDLAELAPVKLAGGLLSAFKGPILGAAQGGLGIQQPGWTPGAPVQVPESASGLPFGMVPSPLDFAGGQQPPGGAPPGSPASGIGAGPAPGPVDQSRHVAVTVNGVDENHVADNVRRQIFNADRVMSYAPKGTG